MRTHALPYALGMKNITPTNLTLQELRFCDAYEVLNSAEKAALSSGYSARSARTTGPRLLRRPAIAAELQSRSARKTAKAENLQDKVIAELSKMAFANIEDLITVDEEGLPQVDFTRATRDQLASVTSVSTKKRTVYNPKGEVVGVEKNAKFTLADKQRALHLLGQTAGMFKPEEQRVVVDVADRILEARARVAKALSGPGDDA